MQATTLAVSPQARHIFNVDIENLLEPLSPGHGRMTLNRGFSD